MYTYEGMDIISNLLCHRSLISLIREIVQGEKDVLMEKDFTLKICWAKEMKKWEYNYFLSAIRLEMMDHCHSAQINFLSHSKCKAEIKNLENKIYCTVLL